MAPRTLKSFASEAGADSESVEVSGSLPVNIGHSFKAKKEDNLEAGTSENQLSKVGKKRGRRGAQIKNQTPTKVSVFLVA